MSALVASALGPMPRRAPGVAALIECLAHSRRRTTLASYDGKVQRFFDFCTRDWPAAGFPPLCPLPASQSTVLAYIGSLFDDGIKASSLKPYLSAINSLHADLRLPLPASGHLVSLAKRGYVEREGEEELNLVQRAPLPADVVLDIVRLGMRTTSLRTLRAAAAIGLAFLFFARGDTGVRLRRCDLSLDARGLHIRAAAKNRPRTHPLTLTAPWPSPVPGCDFPSIHALVARFLAATPSAHPLAPLWLLPCDAHAAWCSARVDDWLHDLLAELRQVPPVGTFWSKHSLRSAGASAALSVGVDVFIIARIGGWSSIETVQAYVDPLLKPTLFAFFVFGPWLRPTLASVLAASAPAGS